MKYMVTLKLKGRISETRKGFIFENEKEYEVSRNVFFFIKEICEDK